MIPITKRLVPLAYCAIQVWAAYALTQYLHGANGFWTVLPLVLGVEFWSHSIARAWGHPKEVGIS